MRKILLHFLIFLPLTLLAFEPHSVTPYPVVGYKEIPFFDQSHQISRNLLIWYPIKPLVKGKASSDPWDSFNVALNAPIATPEIKKPIIVLSHAYGGSPHQLSWLIKKFVYDNYIVLGIQHLDELDRKPQINHWQRPQDIHHILNLFSSQPLAASADLNKIGIAGHSLGGTAAIWLAGGRSTKLKTISPGSYYAHPEEFSIIKQLIPSLDVKKMSQDWHDPRIKAAFVMAPGWAWIFDEKSLEKISIPIYIIAPDADTVLVTSNNAGFFAKNISHSIYQTIPGKGSHYTFISTPNESQRNQIQLPAQLNFLAKDSPKIDRNWIQFEVAEEASGFFNSIFFDNDSN